MSEDIYEGGNLPDFELPDHNGVKRKLSFLQEGDPLLLTINRGIQCAKDRQQLLELSRFAWQCMVGYTKIVTITTDSLLESNDLRLGVRATWPFLHDTERIVQKALDIQEYTDPGNDPMIPHTFVLKPGLVIYKIYNGYWYWGRPSVYELHRDFREITKKNRPDWKIDTPEMKKKWENKEEREKHFFPYGKDMEKTFAEMTWDISNY